MEKVGKAKKSEDSAEVQNIIISFKESNRYMDVLMAVVKDFYHAQKGRHRNTRQRARQNKTVKETKKKRKKTTTKNYETNSQRNKETTRQSNKRTKEQRDKEHGSKWEKRSAVQLTMSAEHYESMSKVAHSLGEWSSVVREGSDLSESVAVAFPSLLC